MEKKTNENEDEAQFPSVELAYEFVKPSYDWMLVASRQSILKFRGY